MLGDGSGLRRTPAVKASGQGIVVKGEHGGSQ
jgi:hypothetical protein